MLDKLCGISERVCGTISNHMRREERELFPLLEQSLGASEQRSLLWRSLQVGYVGFRLEWGVTEAGMKGD